MQHSGMSLPGPPDCRVVLEEELPRLDVPGGKDTPAHPLPVGHPQGQASTPIPGTGQGQDQGTVGGKASA